MDFGFDVVSSAAQVNAQEPIYGTAANALQLTKEQLAGLFKKGWTVWGLGFKIGGKEKRPFELRNYPRADYNGYITARPPATLEGYWIGDGVDAFLLDIADVDRELQKREATLPVHFHLGEGKELPGPSEIHPLNYATAGDAQPLLTPACGPDGCNAPLQPFTKGLRDAVFARHGVDINVEPQTGAEVFKFCGDRRPEFGVEAADYLGPAKSKATTANPKDLFGAVKVSTSKLPAAGKIHGAHAMMDGAIKYGPYNWRDKKVIASIYVDAAERHLFSWFEGQETASDSGVHHLGHAIACLSIILDAQETGNLIDDRPGMGGDADKILQRLSAAIKARKEGAK